MKSLVCDRHCHVIHQTYFFFFGNISRWHFPTSLAVQCGYVTTCMCRIYHLQAWPIEPSNCCPHVCLFFPFHQLNTKVLEALEDGKPQNEWVQSP